MKKKAYLLLAVFAASAFSGCGWLWNDLVMGGDVDDPESNGPDGVVVGWTDPNGPDNGGPLSARFAWAGSWVRESDKKYHSNSIDDGSETWETLRITAPQGGCSVTVRLAASSEQNYDYGYASNLDGSKSAGNYRFRVSGTGNSSQTYSVSSGTHRIFFGYIKDSSQSSGSDRITAEITDIQY